MYARNLAAEDCAGLIRALAKSLTERGLAVARRPKQAVTTWGGQAEAQSRPLRVSPEYSYHAFHAPVLVGRSCWLRHGREPFELPCTEPPSLDELVAQAKTTVDTLRIPVIADAAGDIHDVASARSINMSDARSNPLGIGDPNGGRTW